LAEINSEEKRGMWPTGQRSWGVGVGWEELNVRALTELTCFGETGLKGSVKCLKTQGGEKKGE